jgi:hypothetical protein
MTTEFIYLLLAFLEFTNSFDYFTACKKTKYEFLDRRIEKQIRVMDHDTKRRTPALPNSKPQTPT